MSEQTKPFDPALDSSTDPIALFRVWLDEATASEPNDPNAMALATSTQDGHPSVRMVLMKGLDEHGFSFFTNAESQKGVELLANPNASALFHWKSLRRQVRITGPVSNLSSQDSDHYFHSRSRGSQIGAAVSQQSRPLDTREHLEAAARDFAAAHPDEIPRPAYWYGFALQPDTVELWQDGPDRLHDRMLYTRQPSGWTRTRLYP